MNTAKPYLIAATISQAVLVSLLLLLPFSELLPTFLYMVPMGQWVSILVLLLLGVSLTFREWWPKTTLAAAAASLLSLAIFLSDGFFDPLEVFTMALILAPAVLAVIAYQHRHGVIAADEDLSSLTKEEKRERVRLAKAEVREQKRVAKQEQQAMVGSLVLSKFFGLTRVEIYENGYVRVGIGKYEELRGITGDTNVSKKTGLGRGVGAVATGGLNLFGSNIRGDLYLTIVTSRQTHSLHVDTPSHDAVKAMQELVATGEVVLNNNRKPVADQSSPVLATGSDLAAQLSQLSDLHAKGALTDEQYETAKNRLLKDS